VQDVSFVSCQHPDAKITSALKDNTESKVARNNLKAIFLFSKHSGFNEDILQPTHSIQKYKNFTPFEL